MNVYINACLISLVSSIASSILLTPSFKRLGNKYNFKDIPNDRAQHILPKIRLGGASIVLSFYISLLIGFIFLRTNNFPIPSSFSIFIVFLCLFVFFVLGLVDDLFTLSPFSRLFCQFIMRLRWGCNCKTIKIILC